MDRERVEMGRELRWGERRESRAAKSHSIEWVHCTVLYNEYYRVDSRDLTMSCCVLCTLTYIFSYFYSLIYLVLKYNSTVVPGRYYLQYSTGTCTSPG